MINKDDSITARTTRFRERFGLEVPILLAPMAGACPPSLSIAVSKGGGMGACGAVLMTPDAIARWADDFRQGGGRALQFNLWIPDPPPRQDAGHMAAVRNFIADWCGAPSAEAVFSPQDFEAQCDAILAVKPQAISSIMGVFPKSVVAHAKSEGVAYFATVTTVAEAREAAAAGADVIVAQGMEAGGHRGVFNADEAEASLVGLFALLPAVVDAVDVPVVATGGISDARTIAAALMLGASAVQIGTGYLSCSESDIPSAWRQTLVETGADDTILTRAYTGRAGRALKTRYAVAAAEASAPPPLPYPLQRIVTSAMTAAARKADDLRNMQAWAGQAARLCGTGSAAQWTYDVWQAAQELLPA